MQGVIADAVADLRATYEHREVVTEELADGQVWVTLTGVGIGDGWSSERIDLSVKLQTTFPDTEPYPFYTGPGLQRIDGTQYGPIQPQVQIDGRLLTQVSLNKRQMRTGESLASRFASVIAWLRNPR
jgi:hypothetical protein